LLFTGQGKFKLQKHLIIYTNRKNFEKEIQGKWGKVYFENEYGTWHNKIVEELELQRTLPKILRIFFS
jgi:hypothetical protein